MSASGSIHQISVSNGGVPKRPVRSARVEVGGVVGDHQADRRHHGGPDQDLCLYSLEVIRALQDEGHPIEPGFAGENVTIAGLDWSTIEPGMMLRFGDDLLATVTHDATPCRKNAAWFAGGDFRRMGQDQHPGWSRWYARVLTAGDISVGDAVVVES